MPVPLRPEVAAVPRPSPAVAADRAADATPLGGRSARRALDPVALPLRWTTRGPRRCKILRTEVPR